MDKTVLINNAKKNCLMCNGRRFLRDVSKEKNIVLDSINELYKAFSYDFDSLRHEDADVSLISKAKANKTFCLDLMGTCKACDKEIDKVNREIKGIRL
ncbi:MAG: hypothetical protein V1494_04330 [Candidatus Diapherotrites archaeon]